MKEKIYLDHLNPSFYRKMRETTITGSPDFLFLVKNGYKRMFHVDLLTLLSSIIHNHIRSCRADGFKGDSIMLLSLDQTAVDCLYELMYKDVCEIDSSLVNKVIQDLTKLGFPVSMSLSNHDDETENTNETDVVEGNRTDDKKETQSDMQIALTNTADEMRMDDRDGMDNDTHIDDQSGLQNDHNNNVQNDSHSEANNGTYRDTYSPELASSTSKKARGIKEKYQSESTQDEFVKFYNLFDESLPNPKLFFVGKDIKCFHCDRVYPKVRLWKDHIMNEHHRPEKQEYEIAPPRTTDAWSNRLRLRKRKISFSSLANPEEPFLVASSPTPTPTPTLTTIATTATTTPSRTTLTPKASANPTKLTKRNLKISSPPADESSAISQEDRDIQRITSLIKSLLPHPACFLAEDNNLECFVCGEIFRYRDNWRRHLLEQHFHLTFSCPTCGQKFKRRGKCSEHIARCR